MSLLIGNGVGCFANEGEKITNGPGLRARVAGMALEKHQTALDAAFGALVLGPSDGRPEEDAKEGRTYERISRRRLCVAPSVVAREKCGSESGSACLCRVLAT